MIEVTESAQQKLKEYIEANDVDSPIRVFLSAGG